MKPIFTLWLMLAAMTQAAGLEFEHDLIEVHAGLSDKTVTQDFKFTNTGTETLKIKEADAGCSCLSVQVSEGKFSYAPGESGILRATFEVGSFQGAVDKTIHVWLEGDPAEKPSSKVSLRVHIPVIIALEPRTVKWQVGEKPGTKAIEVSMNHDKPIRITSVSTSNSDFSAKLVTVEEGKKYRVEVTPGSTETAGLSIIRIATDTDVEKQKIQQGFAVVRAPLSKP